MDGETLNKLKAFLVLVNPSGFKLEKSLFMTVMVNSLNGACGCMRCQLRISRLFCHANRLARFFL